MNSVASLIQRYVDEMNGAGDARAVKPLGESHLCTLRVLQRMAIGAKAAAKLTKTDIIDMCKALRQERVPATVNQYVVFLRGVLSYAPSAWHDCEDVSAASIEAARPVLKKYKLTGKSEPRKRRPTDDEVVKIMAEAERYAQHPKCTIKRLPDLIAFSLVSSRRRGELVRITHGDVDYEKRVYWVRDLKHPTRKKGNDKPFVLWPELEAIIRRQPRASTEPSERIFPYDAKSVTKAYIQIKHRLGIENLRLHDNRRDAISKWLLKMPPEDVRLAVSGHDDTKILEKNYDGRSTMEIMQEKYAQLMEANAL